MRNLRKTHFIKRVVRRTIGSGSQLFGCYLFLIIVIGVAAGFSFAYILLACPSPMRIFRSVSINGKCAHQYADRAIADELAKKVRVLCWVMTEPKNHETKAKHVKATWGKRCHKLLFISSAEDNSLPAVEPPNIREGRIYLWGKTKAAFRYVYEHYRNDAEWFLKTDDDTYVIVDNLRYMLADYDTRDPIYFGFRLKPPSVQTQGYMSGGAGYVLSRDALDRLVEKALPNPNLCKFNEFGVEDFEMGKCLYNVGVRAMDSRDHQKRDRFLPFQPEYHLFNNMSSSFWFWKYVYYPTSLNSSCCSDYAVTFHSISPPMMYVFEYFLYHLRPFGFQHGGGPLPRKLKGPVSKKLLDN